MAKLKRLIRCMKCGIVLQSDDKNKIGYITPEYLEEAGPSTLLYCNNCYNKLQALNAGSLDMAVDHAISKILDDAVATDALIIWVVDLFTFSGTLNPDIVRKIKKLNVIVLGTKSDLFPKSVNVQYLENFIRGSFLDAGIKPVGVYTIGGYDQEKIEYLSKQLNILRAGHDVYMIGNLLSGKTTLINSFLKFYENKSRWEIKTITYPGTNVKVMEVPLTNSSFFYELPDLSLSTSVLSKVEKPIQKLLLPLKSIKVENKTLSAGEGVSFGSIACVILHKGKPTNFKIYSAPKVENKRLKEEKIIKLLNSITINHHFAKPISKNLTNVNDFDIFEYKMDKDDKYHDISIEGLGWVTLKGKGQIIRVALPRGTALKERLSRVHKND